MPCTTALTGTPGVGKTTVGDLLKREGYRVLDLNKFISEKGLRDSKDSNRNTYEVDVNKLSKEYKSIASHYDIIEGHFSYLLDLDNAIVLRCRPDILRQRMISKKWKEKKVEENIQSEILDVILIEALNHCDDVFEIDTTDLKPQQVCEEVKRVLNRERLWKYRPGNIDWTNHLD